MEIRLKTGAGDDGLSLSFMRRTSEEIKFSAVKQSGLLLTPQFLARAGLGSPEEMSRKMGEASGKVEILLVEPKAKGDVWKMEVRNHGNGSVNIVCKLDDGYVLSMSPRTILGTHRLQIGEIQLQLEVSEIER